MRPYAARLAWLLLLTLSLCSYALHSRLHGPLLALCALLLTLGKGQLIVDDFMGLRHVRGPWRLLLSSYLGLLTLTLIFISTYGDLA